MTDPLDKLTRAMKAATPAPDPDAKARAISQAEEIFAQGSATDARPTSKRPPWWGGLKGVRDMFGTMNLRGGLVATTAVVAVGMVMVLPQTRELLLPPADLGVTEVPQPLETRGQEKADDRLDDAVIASEADATAPTAQPQVALKRAEAAPSAVTLSEEAESGIAGSIGNTAMMDAEAPSAPRVRQAQDGFAGGLSIVAPSPEPVILPEANTETFANADTNPLKVVAEDPVSTFSIDVDTASYAVVRSSLNRGQLPPKDAVRVEELINYFPYDNAAPTGDHPFQPTVSIMETPWNPDTQLMHIAIQGEMPALEDRPPLNLVFLIDTSGSMQDAAKLPLLKTAFRMMLAELRPEDEVAIVTYAGSAGQVLAPTRAEDRGTILGALDRLQAGGSTAGQAGLQQAYATAEAMAEDGEVTRVILATDGDFNVGLSDPDALKDFIAEKRDTGTYLSVLGFGRGNLDDATMQALAQNGNGTAAYIDTANEARKVLVDQLTGALFPIANDVKIQMEFNPAQIAEYRLIGYETRALNREDFNNDTVDAGEIGAGHSVTAIYEVTPVGSPARLTDPLRYSAETVASDSDELGFLRLRYKRPGEDQSVLMETPVAMGTTAVTDDTRFAAAIAGFGQLLRGQQIGWSYEDAANLATQARGDDPFGYRQEAIGLMRIADSLSR